MSIDFCGLKLAHPVINGSGTFDVIAAAATSSAVRCGSLPFAAYVSKTITVEARAGNPPRACGRRARG